MAPAVDERGVQAARRHREHPIATDTGTAVIKVLEKKEVTPRGAGRRQADRFRDELLADRRNRFFSAYMVKAKQKMKIEVNREALNGWSGSGRRTSKRADPISVRT